MANYKFKIDEGELDLDDAMMDEFINDYTTKLDTSKMSAAQKKAIKTGMKQLRTNAADSEISTNNGDIVVTGNNSAYFGKQESEPTKKSDRYARQHALNALHAMNEWAKSKYKPTEHMPVKPEESKLEPIKEEPVEKVDNQGYLKNRNLAIFGSSGAQDINNYYKEAITNPNLLGTEDSRNSLYSSYLKFIHDNEIIDGAKYGNASNYDKQKFSELYNKLSTATPEEQKNIYSALFALTGDSEFYNQLSAAEAIKLQQEDNEDAPPLTPGDKAMQEQEVKEQEDYGKIYKAVSDAEFNKRGVGVLNSAVYDTGLGIKGSEIYDLLTPYNIEPSKVYDITKDIGVTDKKIYVVKDKTGKQSSIIAKDLATGETSFIDNLDELGQPVKTETRKQMEGIVSTMNELTGQSFKPTLVPFNQKGGKLRLDLSKYNDKKEKEVAFGDNIKFSDMANPSDMTKEDVLDLASALGDVVSIGATFIPGAGTAVGLGLGLASDTGRMAAKLSRGENTADVLKDFGLDLLATGASAIPGLAVGKLAKVAPRIAKFAPMLVSMAQTQPALNGAIDSIKKVANGDFKDLGTEDLKNLMMVLSTVKNSKLAYDTKLSKTASNKPIGKTKEGVEIKLTDDRLKALNDIKGRSERLNKLKEMVGPDGEISIGKVDKVLNFFTPNKYKGASKFGSNTLIARKPGNSVDKEINFWNKQKKQLPLPRFTYAGGTPIKKKSILMKKNGGLIPVMASGSGDLYNKLLNPIKKPLPNLVQNNFTTKTGNDYTPALNTLYTPKYVKPELGINKLTDKELVTKGLKPELRTVTTAQQKQDVSNPWVKARNEVLGTAKAAIDGIGATDAMVAYNAAAANRNTDKLKEYAKASYAKRNAISKPIQSVNYDVHKAARYQDMARGLNNDDVQTSDLNSYLRSRNAQNAQATQLLNQSEAEKSAELRASKAAQEQALYENEAMKSEVDFANQSAQAQASNLERQQLGTLENRKLQNAQALREYFANKAVQREQKEDYMKTVENQFGVMLNDNSVEDIDAEISQMIGTGENIQSIMNSEKYKEALRRRNIADKNRQLALMRAQAGLNAKPYNIGGKK